MDSPSGTCRWPPVTAPLVTLLEFFGGLALIVGLLTRLVALGFVIEMLGAIFIVHIRQGFFPPKGFELPLLLCAASAMLMLGGGGLLSVDAAAGDAPTLSTLRDATASLKAA